MDGEALRRAIREGLARAPGMASEAPERLDALAAELVPFADAVAAAPDGAALPPEARSLAWLFAYRLGDQGHAPLALTSALFAWRDAAGTDAARRVAEEALPLLVDGYARAREDRHAADLQRALGEMLPVTEAAPGVVLAVAAGPLGADAARALAERAGPFILRREARAVVLDVTGLREPDAGTLAELWAIPSSARMLGAHAVVTGDSPELAAAIDGAPVDRDGVRRAPDLAAALELLAREFGVAPIAQRAWLAFAYRALAPGARRR